MSSDTTNDTSAPETVPTTSRVVTTTSRSSTTVGSSRTRYNGVSVSNMPAAKFANLKLTYIVGDEVVQIGHIVHISNLEQSNLPPTRRRLPRGTASRCRSTRPRRRGSSSPRCRCGSPRA